MKNFFPAVLHINTNFVFGEIYFSNSLSKIIFDIIFAWNVSRISSSSIFSNLSKKPTQALNIIVSKLISFIDSTY